MDNSVAAALHTYVKSLRRYAMAITRDPHEADDLVQECLKRALAYLHDGRKIRDLRAYLFTILHNVHSDELSRKKKNGMQLPIDYDGVRLVYPPPQYAYMDCKDLMDAVDNLPEDQRRVVFLVGLEGMSYRAAAEVLGVPIGTVMSRLCRGRNALRKMLAAEPAAARGNQVGRSASAGWLKEGGKINVG